MLSANRISEIKTQAYCNFPSLLSDNIYIYTYSMNEIIKMGINTYNKYLSLLLIKEADIQKLLKEKMNKELSIDEIPTPIEYLIQSAAHNEMFLLELQLAFTTFLQEDVLILPKINSIVVGDPKEKRLINFKNFQDFQDILKIQNKREFTQPPPANETPAEKKMRLLREKVANAKKKKNSSKESSLELVELLEIGETFGIDLNKSLYAFYSLLKRKQLQEKWRQDIQMLCAGADSKNLKTKYWGESLQEE